MVEVVVVKDPHLKRKTEQFREAQSPTLARPGDMTMDLFGTLLKESSNNVWLSPPKSRSR